MCVFTCPAELVPTEGVLNNAWDARQCQESGPEFRACQAYTSILLAFSSQPIFAFQNTEILPQICLQITFFEGLPAICLWCEPSLLLAPRRENCEGD